MLVLENFVGALKGKFTMKLWSFAVCDFIVRDNPFSTYARFSEKLIFLTSWYAHT